MNISQCASLVKKFTTDNAPVILTVAGITGVVTTAVLAGQASYKAADIIKAEKEHLDKDELTPQEIVLATWPLYIPALISGGMTISAIFFATRISTRRAAAIAAAYSISEKAFDEYKTKVVEKFGEQKEQEVRDEVAQDRMVRDRVGLNEVVITTAGDVLCYDMYTGRYFTSDMESLKKAQNDLNYRLLNDFYASLNDFYNLIGLANTKTGDELGWNSDELMEIHFSTTMSDDQRPCIAIDFNVQPISNYFRAH